MTEQNPEDSGVSSALEQEAHKKQVYLFMGPEGSGKSTHAKLFAQKLNLPLIGLGDEFRDLAENDQTELGQEAREMIQKHEYSSSKLYWAALERRLKKDDIKKGFVMEGVFRQKEQLEDNLNDKSFIREIEKHIGETQITIIYLKVPVWESAERLLNRGRVGFDTQEDILKRLNLFYKDLGTRVSLVKNKGFEFVQILGGGKSEEKLHMEILERLNIQ